VNDLKITQGLKVIGNGASISRTSLYISVCSNNFAILHRLRDITTSTVYVTFCMTFISHSDSIRQFKLQATYKSYTFRFVCKCVVVNTCYISRGMGVRKVSNS